VRRNNREGWQRPSRSSTGVCIMNYLSQYLRCAALTIILLISCTAHAQWPVELQWNGVPLGYPKIVSDGHNGAFVGASAFAFEGGDAFFFHVDSAGNSLWTPADSACFIAPGNQYPLALYPDGTGGCVAVIDDDLTNFPNSRHRVQIARYSTQGYKIWQFMPYDTTAQDLHGFSSLAVTPGQVMVSWGSAVPDSVGIWFSRLRLQDGIPLDTPSVRLLTPSGVVTTCQRNDSLYLLTVDSVLIMDLDTGIAHAYRGWHRLYEAKMMLQGDSILILGHTTPVVTSPYLFQRLSGDSSISLDTVASGTSAMGMAGYNGAIYFAYARSGDLFGRVFIPGAGMGDEIVITNMPGNQYYLLMATGTDGVGMAWAYAPEGQHSEGFIQQWTSEGLRWPNGMQISDSVDNMSACPGGRFGLLASAFAGYYFRVQPIDSLVSEATRLLCPKPAARFRLFDPYPNPFNGTGYVEFDLSQQGHVFIALYNILGEQVAVLADGTFLSGHHVAYWRSDVASGVYFLRMKTQWGALSRKLVVLR
jgi:hypothetical protein